MKKQNQISDFEIANKIKAGNDFLVASDSQRKRALMAARILDIDIVTTAMASGEFRVTILKPIT